MESNSAKLLVASYILKKNQKVRIVSKNSGACRNVSLHILKFMVKVSSPRREYVTIYEEAIFSDFIGIPVLIVMGDDDEEDDQPLAPAPTGEESDYDIISAVEKAIGGHDSK